MARPWRIEYEGALYHAFSRGNNQQDIFVTNDDRYMFLNTIGQMSERFDTDIFCIRFNEQSAADSFMDPKSLSNKSKTGIFPVIWIQPLPYKKAS